jgi:hypothetical protein
MDDHHLTLAQAFHLMCRVHSIEHILDPIEEVSLYNKKLLLSNGKVNQTLLFHLKQATQLSLDLKAFLDPKGNDYTLAIADKIEKEFVCAEFMDEAFRKKIAGRYFKGDETIARYFLIFRSLFPVKDKKRNSKWNTKFGFIYDGIGLWDSAPRVAKKFLEVYRKKDIGVFLEATFRYAKDSIVIEDEKIFMTKPYKFLASYEDYYDTTMTLITDRVKAKIERKTSQTKLNV